MKTLLDFKGLVIRSLNSGVDKEGSVTPTGKKLNGVNHCLSNFIKDVLLPVFEDTRVNDVIAVLDSGADYRKKIFPGYKANRGKYIEEMMSVRVDECQAAVKELLKCLGVLMVEVPGVEADDILGWLVQKVPDPCRIYTNDRDIIQLASDSCLVFCEHEIADSYPFYNTSTKPKTLLGNLHPRHVALYKSIVGDASDNYNGIKGFGPKAFGDLMSSFGEDGLDELVTIISNRSFDLLKNIAETEQSKPLMNLYINRNDWVTGWKLANIKPELVNMKIGNRFSLPVWTKRLPDPERLTQLLAAHGVLFNKEKLKNYIPKTHLITKDKWSEKSLEWFKQQLLVSPFVSIDWETSDQLQHTPFQKMVKGKQYVDMLASTLTGAGFTFGENLQHTCYFSLDHADTNNLTVDDLLELLGAIPDDLEIIIQNAYFELNILKAQTGCSLTNILDTKVLASYIDENIPSGLKECSKHYLNYDQIKYNEVIAEGKRMCDYPATHVFKYGADDPLVTAHLFDFYRLISQIEGTYEFFKENEQIPIDLLSDGFVAGVSIDFEEMARQRAEDKKTYDDNIALVRQLLADNQTPDSIEEGARTLYDESIEEVLYDAKAKAVKDGTELLDTTPIEAAHWKKCVEAATYRPRIEVEGERQFDLTPTQFNKISSKLGIPSITAEYFAGTGLTFKHSEVFKSVDKCKAWRETLPGLSRPVNDLLDSLELAIPFNKSTKKYNRNDLLYQEFRQMCLEYVDAPIEVEGFEMNLNSPLQNTQLLYGMLALPIRMRSFELTKTQIVKGLTIYNAQANQDAYAAAIAEDCHDIPWKRTVLEALVEAKSCLTRIGMFYDAYPNWVHPYDGMVHPQINTCGTETRRPSGSAPNALQWPKRNEGVKFRYCILPNKKKKHDLIVSIDWSQQELCIAASLSMDEVFLDCYIGKDIEHVLSAESRKILGPDRLARFLQTNTKDIHTLTATASLKQSYDVVKEWLGYSEEEIELSEEKADKHKKSKKARSDAKPINFGGIYDIGAGKLSRKIMQPREIAKQLLREKKELYYGFEDWRQHIIDTVERQGFVTTALGNIRHVYNQLATADEKTKASIYRQIVNYLIQGLAADNLKRTLTEIGRQGILERTDATIIAPIYDELVFSVHSDNVVDLILPVHKIMTRDIPGLCVPMLAEPSLGVNFGKQFEIGKFPTEEKILRAVQLAKRWI